MQTGRGKAQVWANVCPLSRVQNCRLYYVAPWDRPVEDSSRGPTGVGAGPAPLEPECPGLNTGLSVIFFSSGVCCPSRECSYAWHRACPARRKCAGCRGTPGSAADVSLPRGDQGLSWVCGLILSSPVLCDCGPEEPVTRGMLPPSRVCSLRVKPAWQADLARQRQDAGAAPGSP